MVSLRSTMEPLESMPWAAPRSDWARHLPPKP